MTVRRRFGPFPPGRVMAADAGVIAAIAGRRRTEATASGATARRAQAQYRVMPTPRSPLSLSLTWQPTLRAKPVGRQAPVTRTLPMGGLFFAKQIIDRRLRNNKQPDLDAKLRRALRSLTRT